MSLLNNGTTKTAEAASNRWAGRVRCTAVSEPWWPTTSVVGVAEIAVANTFTCLVHVARAKNGGRWFANMPSTKRGSEWVPTFSIDDADLEKAIASVAIAAVQSATVQSEAAQIAGAAQVDDDDSMPF